MAFQPYEDDGRPWTGGENATTGSDKQPCVYVHWFQAKRGEAGTVLELIRAITEATESVYGVGGMDGLVSFVTAVAGLVNQETERARRLHEIGET